MKNITKKLKGKKVLSVLLAVIMVLSVASPAFSELLGISAKAASEFDVELAFDNLFVFDHWVTNGNSMIIDNDFGTANAGTITDIDFENGSFKFTNNTNHNIYTRAAAGTGDKTEENFDYYRMPVKAGASYTFSCNFTGTSPAFYPFVFFYNESNEFTGTLINGTFTGEGDYSFNFTVPEGASYIQLRLTIAGNDTKDAYAVIKDIAVSRYKFEMDSTNLFSLDSWVGSEKSDQPATSLVAYNDGRVTPQDSNSDGSYDRLYFETNVDANNGVGLFFTDFDYTSYEGYYSMDVKPNTDYTLSYNISGGNALDFQPYIVRYDSNGKFIDFINYVTLNYDVSNFTFTTTADTEYIAVVFSISHQNQSWNLTVQDIGVYETTITDYTVDPVRETYTYNSSNNGTYGTLPTPPAETYPEGYIFAGWYTEEDGKGIRITADTEILPQSMTVYPKFEPEVDSLEVKTPPTKTTYTVGEKINIAGLVLTYGIKTVIENTDDEGNVTSTETVIRTTDISSGFYIDPEYAQDTAGTQTITVHYGGKTATFSITVSAGEDKNIVVNGNTHAVTVANKNYVINYQATQPFNRYEITYSSDSYVKGEIVMDGVTEEFFLEPSGNGTFASYIDSFLRGVNHYNVDSIKFTCLDNEFGNFELLSVTTISATVPSNSTQYYENADTGYKVGVDLSFGGVVSEIYDLNHTGIESRVYNIDGKNVTKVDYADILDEQYGTNYISRETGNINLINKYDRGRYLQQSYYGTSQKPYELGDYNGQEWPYNPVQGGNLLVTDNNGNIIKGNEASKVIDFRITDTQIYVKTRPLDWGKNSEDYPDSYVTDSYMEAWYVFEDDMIKTYCRFVDFSGYPTHTRDQELPAVYIIEPLNHFVYNDVANGSQWTTTNYKKTEEPDFWGVLPEYNALLVADGQTAVDPTVDCYENWAAFAASDDADSFGVGVYSAGVTDFHYGCFFPKYNETEAKNGRLVATENRHAVTTNPAEENPTSYISPVGSMTFESYSPIEYSYYLTTGDADEIYTDFKNIAKKDADAETDKTKIAVPETVYMTPASGNSTVGQYYVNNILDEDDSYNVKTEAVRDAGMYFGLHIKDAETFSVKITNATDPSNDIYLCNSSGSEITESTQLHFDSSGTYTDAHTYGLRFSGAGLSPGEKATAKWEITVYLENGTTETYTAYTVMYAPQRTVGAVAESRQTTYAANEISSWITGANGVDHSKTSPLASLVYNYYDSGYFKVDPLVNPTTLPPAGSQETEDDYIYFPNHTDFGGDGTSEHGTEDSYVIQTATKNNASTTSRSYLGLLTVDKSRYSNTNQIPNLQIGYDVLRKESTQSIIGYEYNSLYSYNTYYTLGTSGAFTETAVDAVPSGWTEKPTSVTSSTNAPSVDSRETIIPSYNVSDIDGKYIHALNKASVYQKIFLSQLEYIKYATAGTSVLCSVTDKAALRDSVLEGYNISKEAYSEDSYNKMVEKLQPAATVLGDPSASQEEIDNAQKELEDALDGLVNVYYSLKYDNIFSAYELSKKLGSMTASQPDYTTVGYENGVITVENAAMTAGETYTKYGSADDYYKVTLQPNTEYVFEYDVTTTSKAQAFMFFYNASGANGDVPTNMSIKTNNGSWSSKTESNAWFGNYTNSAGTYHYAIKFATGANTTQASFRFGNTSSEAVTSSFSNIKLVTSDKYYEDATYSATEAVYKEYASYGTLATVTRPGYTFNGWQDENGTTVTGADIATAHKSIYSTWSAIEYTITYDANGGTVSPTSKKYNIEDALTLPTPTLDGYTFTGWKVTSAEGSWAEDGICPAGDVSAGMYGNVTLTAQWNLNSFPVLFDTILDFSKWNTTTASNGKISNVTANGFTLTSNEGAGEGTSESPEFPVTAGKQYYIDIDFEGDNWDVYIFFRSDTVGGTGIGFTDAGNRFSSSGAGNQTRVFTAPADATKAVIRVDANGSSNSVTFSDIRVYEVDTCAADVYVPDSSIDVTYGDTFGTLPVPTKEGYTFLGWYDGNNKVTAETIVSYSATTTLYSKWQISDTALVADTAVVDFDAPVTINPLDNDTIFMRDGASQTILGFSKDGGSYATTLALDSGTLALKGNEVTFTPSGVVNAVETVYYHASVVIDGKTETIKNQINVAPASNVYYEETKMSNGAAGKVDWATTGEQAASNSVEDDVVYGYNSAYDASSTYSNGTALEAVVNSTNKTASTKTFTFTGTGVDIISACGRSTGVIVVNVKDSNGKRVKGYIVDTYYSKGSFGGDELITQVPVVNWSGDYGTYTVDVAAMYLSSAGAVKETIKSTIKNHLIDTGLVINSAAPVDNNSAAEMLENAGLEEFIAEDMEFIWFDDNSVLNGGTGVEATKTGSRGVDPGTATLYNYIDGFRVYNPLDDDFSLYSETEKNVSYANVVANLAEIEDDSINDNLEGIAYITGSLADGEALTFAKYQEVGPKGELYLNGGKSISFKITVQSNERIMLGLRAVNGAVENINISSETTFTVDKVNSATEMYYDITSCLSDAVKANGGEVKITVNNTDDTMLAINHIKFSGADSIVTNGITARSVTRSGDTSTEVAVNRFLPMTQADLDEIQTVLTGESTPATIQNGVVVPIVDDDDTTGDNTTGDDTNTGDDTTGDNTTGDDTNTGDDTTGDNTTGDDTTGDDTTSNTFDIFSLLKMLLAFIENILRGAFGNGNIF